MTPPKLGRLAALVAALAGATGVCVAAYLDAAARPAGPPSCREAPSSAEVPAPEDWHEVARRGRPGPEPACGRPS